jgi:hypothetical protein
MSVTLPDAYGTIRRTDLLGKLSDAADETAAVTNAKLAQKCRESSFMFDP